MSIKYLNWAWRQNLKTPLQKLVLLKLGDNADDEGRAFPSIDLMAKFTCSNEKTVRNNIKHLESFGLITVFKQPARGGHLRNEYMLHLEVKLNYKDEEEESITTPEEPGSGSSEESVTGSKREEIPDNHQSIHQSINHKKTHGSSIDKPSSKKVDEDFEHAWSQYPKREGANPKNKALSAWNARRKEGVEADVMINGVFKYMQFCATKGQVNTSYVMQGSRFFGKELNFNNDWSVNHEQNQRPSTKRPMSAVERVTAANRESYQPEQERYPGSLDIDGEFVRT